MGALRVWYGDENTPEAVASRDKALSVLIDGYGMPNENIMEGEADEFENLMAKKPEGLEAKLKPLITGGK